MSRRITLKKQATALLQLLPSWKELLLMLVLGGVVTVFSGYETAKTEKAYTQLIKKTVVIKEKLALLAAQ